MKYLKDYFLSTRKRKDDFNPSEYLRMPEKQRKKISSVEIIPPDLGSDGFGSIVVRYKQPITNYELLTEQEQKNVSRAIGQKV